MNNELPTLDEHIYLVLARRPSGEFGLDDALDDVLAEAAPHLESILNHIERSSYRRVMKRRIRSVREPRKNNPAQLAFRFLYPVGNGVWITANDLTGDYYRTQILRIHAKEDRMTDSCQRERAEVELMARQKLGDAVVDAINEQVHAEREVGNVPRR